MQKPFKFYPRLLLMVIMLLLMMVIMKLSLTPLWELLLKRLMESVSLESSASSVVDWYKDLA